ncbi:hypothetical protein V8C86DRAFT_2643540 [Haematococcus lacustris]
MTGQGCCEDVFDLAGFENVSNFASQQPSAEQLQLCKRLAECLERTGLVLVKDVRVPSATNEQFLDTMEQYFGHADKAKDVRADLCYQVGLTPSGVERPRVLGDVALQAELAGLAPDHAGSAPTGPDVKERFMVRVGKRPQHTAFPELNAEPVLPAAFPSWSQTMDSFGSALLGVAASVACAASLGWGLPAQALVKAMEGGPHLLAPTGCHLDQHGELGTVIAGYHSDLNLLTVHGKSRFPGLFVWTADGRRVPVRVPPGCLLVQAGQQLERLTGGRVKAGKHEVVVSSDTVAAISAARAAGRSLWRVSSTLFAHCASDYTLRPLGCFATPAACTAYPEVLAGQQVQDELQAINLRREGRKHD